MKLSKAIIAKYGITKKAWQVQRGQKSSSRSVKHMARRRYGKKSHSRSGNPMMNRAMGVLIGAAVSAGYGAVRQPLAEKLPNVAFLGNYSDEAILGGTAAAVRIISGNKYVGMATKPIMNVEFARMGEKLKVATLGYGSNSTKEGAIALL